MDHGPSTLSCLAGLEGVRSFGAVRVSTVTPAAMTANAPTAMAIFTGLSVKRSSNSQMLKTMATNGSMITRTGCDTLNGPTCRADCSSSVPVTAATASAYTGHRVSTPLIPNVVRVSVTVLRNVAIRAQANAAAIAKTAARCTGGPRLPSPASTAMLPPNTDMADSHSAVSGAGCPPVGSATVRNTPSATQTTSTAAHAARATSWWIQARRSTNTKTSSVTRTGWTTDSWPLCRARAWKTNEPTAAAPPASHSGCRNR